MNLIANDDPREIDPDPFSIGIAIFSAMAGGAAFLETRRGRRQVEFAERRAFRAAWYATRRSLIAFWQAIDEFETYMLEDGYDERAFRIGAVRLTVDVGRKQQMRALMTRALETAGSLGDAMDDLSDFLGEADQQAVDAVLDRLAEIGRQPDAYADVVRLGREAHALYDSLLATVAEREGFGRRNGDHVSLA
jgi:hypothetical protein